MTLIETVQLPGPPDRAWELLAEGGGALRLAPGITVGPEGRGTLRIVLAGHSLTYRGYARQHVEEAGRHLTWTLSGKEVRGAGRAHAEIRARFRAAPEGGTDLRLTVLVGGRGRLAQALPAEQDRAIRSAIARFRRAIAQQLDQAERAPVAEGRGAPETGAATRPQPRLEVMPPSPAAARSPRPVQAALGALALGVLALLLWRRRRSG